MSTAIKPSIRLDRTGRRGLVFILGVIFFATGILAHAQEVTADDFIEKINSIVNMDMEQEDQLKPILAEYVVSINKINDLIQKNVDKQLIAQKLFKLNSALDLKLKVILTSDQMHLWDKQKRVIYKDILTSANVQDQ